MPSLYILYCLQSTNMLYHFACTKWNLGKVINYYITKIMIILFYKNHIKLDISNQLSLHKTIALLHMIKWYCHLWTRQSGDFLARNIYTYIFLKNALRDWFSNFFFGWVYIFIFDFVYRRFLLNIYKKFSLKLLFFGMKDISSYIKSICWP